MIAAPVLFPCVTRHDGLGDGHTLAAGELRDGDGDVVATRAAAKS